MEKLRVLVVDDEPGMRAGAARVLEGFACALAESEGTLGFEVEQADSGEAALARIAESPPDIVLLDQKLPGLSGLDVMDRLEAERRDVLVIMITAYATLQTAVSATKLGAFDFLAKPFTPTELRATLAKAGRHVALRRQARRHAEEKKRIRFEFVSVLAHELKAPLAAVEGYLSAMEDRALGDDLGAYRTMIARSTARLAGMRKLVEDLLDLTRIESGQRERVLETVDVREAAREALENVRADAQARRVELRLREGPPAPLHADRSEIDLVLGNLLSNAVKYNRDGGRVDVSVECDDERVVVRVQDTGIGLAPEEQARLFGDFVRIKNDQTRHIPGSGLGLATVRKVARLYEGDARVSSEKGVGSTFEVVLRRNGHADAAAAPARA